MKKQAQIEIYLRLAWCLETYVTHGKYFGTVEIRFSTEELIKENSVTTLKNEQLWSISTYLVWRIVKVEVVKVLREMDTSFLVAAVLYSIEDKIKIR